MSEKIHADNAEKQKAYRERLQAKKRGGSAGFTDSELGRAARDLHLSLELAASQDGNERAAQLLGPTPLDTIRNVQGHITRPPK